ncbi:hypothetical protein ACFFWC_17560 [Plantactinospora siamensis]|uniref:DUF3533 domain-containing protein n=1 Tax=Plantactinospora siamensis TaxID=555372 RepID=A0ABV6NPS1_9ACTN
MSHESSRRHGRWGRIAEPVRDAAFRRTLLRGATLLLGTLVITTAFIAAYAGALHNPRPRALPVAVAAGDGPAHQLLAGVRARTTAVREITYASPAAANDALGARDVYAVLASGPGGLTLRTASAGSPAAAEAVTGVIGAAAQTAGAPLSVTDAYPTSSDDRRGLVPFYLAIGLVLGGYLGTAALGISLGTVPRTLGRATLRVAAFAIYSVLLGLSGWLVTGPALGVFTRHGASVAGAGMLIAFAAAMVAAAAQGWLGMVGTGLVILLLVVLGNPGSGGVYAPEFLPGPFGSMHRWNIPGLATDLIKSVAYFPARAAHWPLLELALWALAGLLALLVATRVVGGGAAPRHER